MLISSLLGLSILMAKSDSLIIVDSVVGKGAAVKKGDLVTVLYRGTLESTGLVFDENLKQPPFAFEVGAGEVIQGWDKGLVGMKIGGKRSLKIPPSLGYGDQANAAIPAGSTLNFDIELLRIDSLKKPSDIAVEITQVGTGPEAKLGDEVEIHYVGTFLNAVKFDSSRDRDKTFTITLGKTGLIPGFTKGVTGMKKGERRKVTIPYNMAYGKNGRPSIPPYSTLVFDLEVINLTPAKQN
ncbi:MAG: FKBP-type peptidyl-prolyl cis-trans isomerase [Armatimonadetes bacterium]|nr:FKBP-type peptidyl-prolyl cis-trans isomerase [Armatimonadota bacterium]